MASYQNIVQDWPQKSRQACERIVEKYGPPDEACDSRLIWHGNGPWKRTELSRDPVHHNWPMEHEDMVESVLAYRVPLEKADDLAHFDGSVIIERTKGELSARCEAEEANFLALNLAHEICTGKISVLEARESYAQNMAKKQSEGLGPYMQRLQFDPPGGDTADPDTATLEADGTRIRSEEEAMQSAGQVIGTPGRVTEGYARSMGP